MDVPTTISEAEISGWPYLSAHCATCRFTIWLHIPVMAKRYGQVAVTDVAAKLVCRRCGTPSVAVALLRMQPRCPGGAPKSEELTILDRRSTAE